MKLMGMDLAKLTGLKAFVSTDPGDELEKKRQRIIDQIRDAVPASVWSQISAYVEASLATCHDAGSIGAVGKEMMDLALKLKDEEARTQAMDLVFRDKLTISPAAQAALAPAADAAAA